MTSPAPAVEAIELYRFFHVGDDEVFALRGVTLVVEPGEMVAVVGPSGSGKSTLLGCLAGLDDPDGGSVRVAGRVMSRRPEAERAALRASRVGMLYQAGNLVSHLTVAQNVRAAQRLTGRVDPARAGALLAGLGLSHRAGAYPSMLSGGEGARAGLATALANDPAVLLADEPTGEVDAATERRVLELLTARAHEGAVVVATHSPAVAAVADRVVVLADGRVTA